jgi:glutathione S-transferase
MTYTAIVILLALVEYIVFQMAVGRARVRYEVEAPAVTGNEIFERYYRVQANTVEQLVLFVPAMVAFAYFVGDLWAAGVGIVWIIGRYVYFRGYVAAPEKRGTGMMLTAIPNMILVIGALIGAGIGLATAG